jgi:transcription initiation factor TFIIB
MVKDSYDKLSEIDSRLKTEIMETQTCPKCHNTRLMRDYESIEVVCMDCGFVVDQKNTYKEKEQTDFNEKQRIKRAKSAGPLTYTIHNKGSATVIDWHNRSNNNKSFSISQKANVYHLRKWHKRTRVTVSTDHNLTYALSEIAKIANKMDLPEKILETAAVIYQKAVKEGLTYGRSIQSIATASLYLACRQNGLLITLDKFSRITSVNKKEVGKNYRFLIKKFDYAIPPLQPNQCITKFSNDTATQKRVEEIIHKILTAAKDSKLTAGRNPTGIAAAAGYIALVLIGEEKTHKDIAVITQNTEVTIKNRYKELVNRLIFEISL